MWKVCVIVLLGTLILFWLFLILVQSGMGRSNIPSWVKNGFLKREGNGYIPGKFEIGKIIAVAIGFRLFLYIISVLILFLLSSDQKHFELEMFYNAWCRWDGPHYVDVARFGYEGALEDGQPLFLVFFPLYPYLMRMLYPLFQSYEAAGMAISVVSYAVGCGYLYRLAALDYGKKVAEYSVLLISIFPFSFFFGSVMTESLFFLLTTASLYYIRTHKWLKASLLGGLASQTRMHGLLLIIPAFVELCVYYKGAALIKKRKWGILLKILIQKGLCLFLMFGGTAFYLYENYRVTKNPFAFLYFQKNHWHQGSTLITNTLEYVFKNAFQNSYSLSSRGAIWIPNAMLFLIGLFGLIVSLKWLRSMYTGYYMFYFIVNFSVTWLLSGGRYMSCAVPLFLTGAIAASKNRLVKYGLISFSAILFGIYFTAHLSGNHVY